MLIRFGFTMAEVKAMNMHAWYAAVQTMFEVLYKDKIEDAWTAVLAGSGDGGKAMKSWMEHWEDVIHPEMIVERAKQRQGEFFGQWGAK